jgi:hypothetical protein
VKFDVIVVCDGVRGSSGGGLCIVVSTINDKPSLFTNELSCQIVQQFDYIQERGTWLLSSIQV